MFRKFFQALAALTANTEDLAASIKEANVNLRQNLGMDAQPVDQPAQLEHHEEAEAEANGTKRKARARG
jgi:hypothetical protein